MNTCQQENLKMSKKKSVEDAVHLHILITKKQMMALETKAKDLGVSISSLVRLMLDDKLVEK